MPRPETIDMLHRSPLMADVAVDVTRELVQSVEEIELDPGDVLFHQGEVADAVYLVVSGELAATASYNDGREIDLGLIRPGDPVGELAVMLGNGRAATVRAREPSLLARVSSEALGGLLERSAALQEALENETRRRLRRNQLAEIIELYFGLGDLDGRRELERRFQWQEMSPGDILFRQGDPADSLYIVVRGEVWVVGRDEQGGDAPIASLGNHEIIGEMGPLSDQPRAAAAVAARPSLLVRLEREDFEELARQYPSLMMRVTRQLVDRLRRSQRKRSAARGGCRRIVVLTTSPRLDARRITGELLAHLEDSAERIGSPEVGRELGRESLAAAEPGDPASAGLDLWLEERESVREFVFYPLEQGPEEQQLDAWSQRCLRRADELLILADVDESPEPRGLEATIQERYRGGGVLDQAPRRRVVLVSSDEHGGSVPAERWLGPRAPDSHYHLQAGSAADMARVARLLAHRGVGLALGGTGARCLVQLGVIQALEEAGVPLDMVAGTGLGGVIAAFYGSGRSPEQILAETDWSLLGELLGEGPGRGDEEYQRNRLDNDSRQLFGSTRIEDLRLPLACASANLTRQTLSVHRRGPLWKAMRATTAVPGVTPPILYGDEIHVDGAVINGLPAEALGDDASRVVTIDARPERGGAALLTPRRRHAARWLRRLGLAGWLGGERPPAQAELLMSSVAAASRAQAERTRATAQLNFLPPVDGIALDAFQDPRAIAQRGYEHARGLLETLGPDGVRRRLALA